MLLLSGDVHYTAATALSYWTKGNAVPARIVQFTGSGFKNVMPWYIGAVDRVLSFAQRMVRVATSAPSAWAGTRPTTKRSSSRPAHSAGRRAAGPAAQAARSRRC